MNLRWSLQLPGRVTKQCSAAPSRALYWRGVVDRHHKLDLDEASGSEFCFLGRSVIDASAGQRCTLLGDALELLDPLCAVDKKLSFPKSASPVTAGERYR